MKRVVFWLGLLAVAASLLAGPASAAARESEGDKALALLKRLIQFDTSNAPGDTTAAAAYLKSLFDPLGVPTEIIVAPNGKAAHFLARLPGDGSLPPVLLAAHLDVVPAQADKWSVDPFAGVEKDGFLYGRGALDNKGSVAVFARAVLRLAEQKTPLRRDIIFLAEADEEQGRYNTGWLAQNHWEKIDAAFALNEGGETLLDSDNKVRQVNITVADKVTLNLKLKATGPSGHSSRPLPAAVTANGQLVDALANLRKFETPVRLLPEVRAYLRAVARLHPGPLQRSIEGLLAAGTDGVRLAAARAVLAAEPAMAPGLEGKLRNTLVLTMINAGIKPNVIPGEAEAILNARLLPGASVEAFVQEVRNAIANPAVQVEILNALPAAEQAEFFRKRTAIMPSDTRTDLFAAIARNAMRLWPGADVVPTLLVASTDATPWRLRGVPVYGISPFPSDLDTYARIHGNDERVRIESVRQGSEFVYGILRDVAAR